MTVTAFQWQPDSTMATTSRRHRLSGRATRRIASLAAAGVLATLAGLATTTEPAAAASYDWNFRPPGVTVKFNRSETKWIAGGNKLAGYYAAARYLGSSAGEQLWIFSRSYASYLYYHRNQCLWIYADVMKGFNYGGWRC